MSVMGSLALAAAALGIAQNPAAPRPAVASSTTNVAHPMIPAPSIVVPIVPSTTTTTAPPPTTTTTTTAAPAAGATAQTATAEATQMLVYDPYTVTGALAATVVVTQQLAGKDCVSNGAAGQASYRCFTTSQPVYIYDPCYPAPGATTGPVVCPTAGPGPDVVEVSMGSLPPVTTAGPAQRLWAFELANGQICTLVAAAWGGLGPFACAHTAAPPGPLADCHAPVEQAPTWSAACQTQATTAAPFATYPVEKAWT